MANPTTLQLGAYSYQTDTFGAHPAAEAGAILDLNDGVTWSLLDAGSGLGDGLNLGMPQATVYTVGNPRVTGRRRVRRVYDQNRTIKARLILLPQSSYAAFINAMHALISLMEGITEAQPAALKIQPPGSSSPVYADVIAAQFTEAQFSEMLYVQLLTDGIEIAFECAPHLHGPRQWLQNLVFNPGFEAPSAAGTIAFSDTLANFNAYVPQQYQAAVAADTPLRYYRMQEVTGTTAIDSGSALQNGTYTGGVTLGQAGICGGASFAALFNGTSGYISCPTTGLPSVNHAFSVEFWMYFTSNPGSINQLISLGTNTTNEGVVLQLQTNGHVTIQFFNGTAVTSTSALATSAWHHVAATWDGTTLTLYVDGASTGTPITPGAANVTFGVFNVGANFGGVASFFGGTLDEVAVYSAALSSARVTAHYNAGAPTTLAQDTLQYPDVIGVDTPQRYYRLDEASGTTAFDASGNAQNGTTHGAPTQGVAGALAGDTDTAYTFAAASSQYVSAPVTSLPTGNAAISLEGWMKFAANPASTQAFIAYGATAGTNSQFLQLQLTSAGLVQANVGAGSVSSTALATATYHHIVATWDGTTLRLYVDGASVGTPATPGAQAIPSSSTVFNIAENVTGGAFYFSGQLDEVAVYGAALSSGRVTAHYNAGHVAPVATADTMLIPAGGRVSFGSPAWGAIQTWQVRFRWLTASAPTFYLHYTDANNYLAVTVTGTTLAVVHVVAGITHTLASTSSLGLVNGLQYWLKIVQFPALASVSVTAPYVQASLYADNNGVAGTQVQTTAGPAQCFNFTTALSGAPQVAASGAALALGGNVGGVQQVALWGPGTWSFTAENATTGQAAAAWDATAANAYSLGPFASRFAARIDFPPAGTVNAYWNLYTGNAVANTGAMPTTSGNTLAVSAYVRTTGMSASAQQVLWLREFDINGSFLRTTAVASHTGNLAAYTLLSGTIVTGASTAYCDLQLNALDISAAAASANATAWFDNCQVWDVTATGMATMPYCELRYVQSPAQLQTSGLLGDVPAPATLCCGLFLTSLPTSQSALLYLGRRAQGDNMGTSYAPGAQLIGYIWRGAPALDTTAYGGFRLATTYPGVLANTMAQSAGVYELFARAQTSSGSPTTVYLQSQVNSIVAPGVNAPSVGNDTGLAYTLGNQIYPFTTQNAWAITDLGQVTLPPSVVPIEGDPTRLGSVVQTTNAGPINTTSNYLALIPKDGELHISNVVNPAGGLGTVTNQWLFTYFDGLAGTCNVSAASAGPTAAPTIAASSFGAVSSSTPFVTSNPLASVYPTVDPSLLTLHSGGSGVNQYGCLAVNNNDASLPSVALDVIYWPRYLALS